jgi:hypothetical protein
MSLCLALVTGEPAPRGASIADSTPSLPQLKAPGSIDEQHAACHPSSASFWDSAGLPRLASPRDPASPLLPGSQARAWGRDGDADHRIHSEG